MTPQEQLRKFRESQLSPQELLQKFRAQSKNNPFGEKAKTFEELEAASVGQDRENFDYKTGAKAGIRAALSFMETPEEKENLLKQKVGSSGFTKDSKGRLALTPEGQKKLGYDPINKNLIIEEEGFPS